MQGHAYPVWDKCVSFMYGFIKFKCRRHTTMINFIKNIYKAYLGCKFLVLTYKRKQADKTKSMDAFGYQLQCCQISNRIRGM